MLSFSHLFISWSMSSVFNSKWNSWIYYLLKKGELCEANEEDCWSYIGLLGSMAAFEYWWTFHVRNELIQIKKLGLCTGEVVDGLNFRGIVTEGRLLLVDWLSLKSSRMPLIGWLSEAGSLRWIITDWENNLIQFCLLLFTMTIKQWISS